MSERLARLEEAHVQHELASWRGEALAPTIAARVRSLFRWLDEIKLDDVVTRAQITGVIERYAIELRVSGGITELQGEMTQLVIGSRASAETRLDQIVAPESYEEFADKVLSLDRVRRELISLIAHSSTASAIGARLIARGLLDLLSLPVAVSGSAAFASLPAFATRLRTDLLPEIERRVAAALARYLEHNRERLADEAEKHLIEVLDSERLRSVIDDLWDSVSSRKLSEVFAFVGGQDVEDFVVLVYEFWLRYRKTEFFRRISAELVDYFFTKYGQETLLALIDDMGVSEAMVRDEILVFLGPILEHASRTGALEQHVRARLAAFYRSPAARAALAEPAG
jgi:hypothetical protein